MKNSDTISGMCRSFSSNLARADARIPFIFLLKLFISRRSARGTGGRARIREKEEEREGERRERERKREKEGDVTLWKFARVLAPFPLSLLFRDTFRYVAFERGRIQGPYCLIFNASAGKCRIIRREDRRSWRH